MYYQEERKPNFVYHYISNGSHISLKKYYLVKVNKNIGIKLNIF